MRRSEALAHRYIAVTSGHIKPLHDEANRLAEQVQELSRENAACSAEAHTLERHTAELHGQQVMLREREKTLCDENRQLREDNRQLQQALAQSEVSVIHRGCRRRPLQTCLCARAQSSVIGDVSDVLGDMMKLASNGLHVGD
jgi:regulator of replication initiation timing